MKWLRRQPDCCAACVLLVLAAIGGGNLRFSAETLAEWVMDEIADIPARKAILFAPATPPGSRAVVAKDLPDRLPGNSNLSIDG